MLMDESLRWRYSVMRSKSVLCTGEESLTTYSSAALMIIFYDYDFYFYCFYFNGDVASEKFSCRYVLIDVEVLAS